MPPGFIAARSSRPLASRIFENPSVRRPEGPEGRGEFTISSVEEKNAGRSTRQERDKDARGESGANVKVCIIGGGGTPLYTAVLLKQYRIIKSIRLAQRKTLLQSDRRRGGKNSRISPRGSIVIARNGRCETDNHPRRRTRPCYHLRLRAVGRAAGLPIFRQRAAAGPGGGQAKSGPAEDLGGGSCC